MQDPEQNLFGHWTLNSELWTLNSELEKFIELSNTINTAGCGVFCESCTNSERKLLPRFFANACKSVLFNNSDDASPKIHSFIAIFCKHEFFWSENDDQPRSS